MPDRQTLLASLIEFVQTETDTPIAAPDEATSLRDGLGLDSVDLVGVIMRIEGHFRIRLTHPELEKVETVGHLLDLILAKLAEVPTAKAA